MGLRPHYPSWGSGTEQRLSCHGRGPELITPHGDREPERNTTRYPGGETHYPSWGSGTGTSGTTWLPRRKTHYPSWGSGTVLTATGGSTDTQLITPHGDRELTRSHGTRTGGQYLITPHGDREPPAARVEMRQMEPHYPSWGSGTQQVVAYTQMVLQLITPHGDRELWFDQSDSTLKHSLITPHGDRERKLATSPCSLFGVSLPLMGIGNLAGVRARCPQVELITPHGDREQEDGQGPHEAGGRSLPLMGIGNPAPFGVVLGDFNSLPLMGIGNVPEGRRQRRYRQPHYPSWGSGTWTSSPRTRLRRRAAHYPSWGSGTCDAPEFEALADGLITPHGDREPSSRARAHARRAGSLPLMGIGNTRSSRTTRPPRRTHYPSWGSGTRRVPAMSVPIQTHYPSWGSGTNALTLGSGGGTDLITPHGDREPTAAGKSPLDASPISLPLMGIGNLKWNATPAATH